jgi:hypothetical protein
MMQFYKEAVKADDTNTIHVEVEEGWKLLLRKDGDTRRYRDALLKDECSHLVEDAIAEFGMQHGVCSLQECFFSRETDCSLVTICTGDYMRMTGRIRTIPWRM